MSKNNKNKIKFIIGTGRSGTHWLSHIINSSEEFRALIEKRIPFFLVSKMALDPRKVKYLMPILNLYYKSIIRHSSVEIIEKSHPNIWQVEKLLKYFPDTEFIAIQRNPFATVASMLKHKGVLKWHKKWKEFPIPNKFLGITEINKYEYGNLPLASKCALRWQSHFYRLLELKKIMPEKIHIVSYERMITHTREELKKLEIFLEVDSSFTQPRIKKASLNRWKQELSKKKMDDIQGVLEVPVTENLMKGNYNLIGF